MTRSEAMAQIIGLAGQDLIDFLDSLNDAQFWKWWALNNPYKP